MGFEERKKDTKKAQKHGALLARLDPVLGSWLTRTSDRQGHPFALWPKRWFCRHAKVKGRGCVAEYRKWVMIQSRVQQGNLELQGTRHHPVLGMAAAEGEQGLTASRVWQGEETRQRGQPARARGAAAGCGRSEGRVGGWHATGCGWGGKTEEDRCEWCAGRPSACLRACSRWQAVLQVLW